MRRALFSVAALAVPAGAAAHGFGRLYNLPVPLWLYAWGAAAALVLSFAGIAFFATAPAAGRAAPVRDLEGSAFMRALRAGLPALRVLSVAGLLLAIATGWLGSRDPARNFGMIAFWIVFLLAGTYFAALAGNAYAVLNPWRVLCGWLGRVLRGYPRGRIRYPERLGDWPALALYVGFIWIELFAFNRPRSLAVMLTAYTALNFLGVGLVGAAAWFRHCEFFSVFLRLCGVMAFLDCRPAPEAGGRGTLQLRPPLAGLVHERPAHLATVVFVLAMLSTTAFDGLRATQPWVMTFWGDDGLGALGGTRPVLALAALRPWYVAWDTLWLLASPFLYFAAYVAAVALARRCAGGARPLRELLLDFAFPLLPIALVYNFTHYFTLFLGQGPKIVSLLSDPFGWHWNLFGTARLWRAPILLPMGFVWHAQVALILLGHVASMVAAHRVALRVFGTRAAALRSQLPVLGLMVAFTVAGLWILSQPLTTLAAR